MRMVDALERWEDTKDPRAILELPGEEHNADGIT